MKKLIIGFVLGVVLAVGGSALAMPGVVTQLTPAEQMAKGNVFNIYTGQRLGADPVVLSPVEIRLRAIESRLDRLEAKK